MPVRAQTYCDETGNEQARNVMLPWRLRPETQTSARATYMQPIIQEMQRLYPKPPKGLELTYGIFNAAGNNSHFAAGIDYYHSFFMIKDIRCEKINGKYRLQPEGETGCWIYFKANHFKSVLDNYASSTKLYLPGTRLPVYVAGDIRIEENENSLKGIYVFNSNDEQQFAGWYFSSQKKMPFRRLSKYELAQVYRYYWTNKYDADIKRLEDVLQSSQKTIASVSAEKGTMTEQEKQDFFKSIRESDQRTKEYIEEYKRNREDCLRKTEAMMKAPDAQQDAFIKNLNDMIYEPAGLEARGGKGSYVYIEDEKFFTPQVPKSKPQYIIGFIRRQDDTEAKTLFIKKVEEVFDWNVVRKIVGMPQLQQPVTIAGAGNTPGGYTSGAIASNKADEAGGVLFAEDFSDNTTGQAPKKWTVSNNTAVIKNDIGAAGNWLAMKKEGLFFPDYATLLLPTSFTLEFDLRWNENISYYNPSFMFHIGAAVYDKTLKRYDRAQVNVNAYTSARMERICLWIDPHWNNNDSQYGLQVFDKQGGYLMKKSDKTPLFFKYKNSVHVRLVREGASLSVYFNNTKVLQEASVMSENIRWNFFGCGLNDAPNADDGDEFYISNIRLSR
jgi:hypothetical protein